MQTIGYIFDRETSQKILLLVRQASYYRLLKKRKSGKDGVHFSDEEEYLNDPDNKIIFDKLKNESVIGI